MLTKSKPRSNNNNSHNCIIKRGRNPYQIPSQSKPQNWSTFLGAEPALLNQHLQLSLLTLTNPSYGGGSIRVRACAMADSKFGLIAQCSKAYPLAFLPPPTCLKRRSVLRTWWCSPRSDWSMATQNSSRSVASSSANNHHPSMLVFSGGTAFNGVVEELKKLTTRVAHVLPVSDDGGSTAEIVRVLGGPAVGDIRSRCLRLSDESTLEALAVRRLLGHRLPLDGKEAKSEWYNIVEGEHTLWKGVSIPYRETIRAFLVYFQNQILRRANESFCFSNGSIGNFFFAGARIFFDSLDPAIFLFSRVSDIPTESLVLPVISTNDRLTLGCELWDGTIIRGQNEISHPAVGLVQHVDKTRSSVSMLHSKIKRIFYMSSEGRNLLHEVFPSVNPRVLEQLSKVDCIVYAMGSLFTSVCPSLVLRGIGEIISSRSCPKVLLLNGSYDRETIGLSATGFVTAITDALNRTYGDPERCLKNAPSHYINALLVPRGGQIPVDCSYLEALGISHVITVDSIDDPKVGIIFDPKSLSQALADLILQRKLQFTKI